MTPDTFQKDVESDNVSHDGNGGCRDVNPALR